jgi:hypothetical protein
VTCTERSARNVARGTLLSCLSASGRCALRLV